MEHLPHDWPDALPLLHASVQSEEEHLLAMDVFRSRDTEDLLGRVAEFLGGTDRRTAALAAAKYLIENERLEGGRLPRSRRRDGRDRTARRSGCHVSQRVIRHVFTASAHARHALQAPRSARTRPSIYGQSYLVADQLLHSRRRFTSYRFGGRSPPEGHVDLHASLHAQNVQYHQRAVPSEVMDEAYARDAAWVQR